MQEYQITIERGKQSLEALLVDFLVQQLLDELGYLNA